MTRVARVARTSRTTSPIGIRELRRRQDRVRDQLSRQIVESRTEAGVTQGALAAAAGVSQSFVSKIESGQARPSVDVLVSIASCLGAELGVRLFPTTGPRLVDRFQAPMVEALLRELHARWQANPEVPVPSAHGVIDVVLRERNGNGCIACECHSELRRLEQVLRRASEKVAGLRALRPDENVSPLLLLRSTVATREIARRFEVTLAAAYPGRSTDALTALRGDAPWPGASIVWVRLEGGRAEVLDGPPRGVRLGR